MSLSNLFRSNLSIANLNNFGNSVLIVTEPGSKPGGGTKGPDNSSRKLLGLTILYSGR